MLVLALTNGYNAVWKIFGSANQLLAALALLAGTTWLIHHRRPVWYTLLPAIFMLITSITMLIRLLVVVYVPGWPGTALLLIADVIVLAMTTGILFFMLRTWQEGKKLRMQTA